MNFRICLACPLMWCRPAHCANGTKRIYYLYFELQDKNGNKIERQATLVVA